MAGGQVGQRPANDRPTTWPPWPPGKLANASRIVPHAFTINGQKTHRLLAAIGEAVVIKIPRSKQNIGVVEDRFVEHWIWSGMLIRTGEIIIL